MTTEQDRVAALADRMKALKTEAGGTMYFLSASDIDLIDASLRALARPAPADLREGWKTVPATEEAAAAFCAEMESGQTWWQKGRDVPWLESLSDKKLAEEASALAMDLSDGDFGYLDAFAPVQGIISTLADRLALLPQTQAASDARCVGCGSKWTDADLERERIKRGAEFLSCCPERKPLTIDQWRERAERFERLYRAASGKEG